MIIPASRQIPSFCVNNCTTTLSCLSGTITST
nr:MAG TPA: hypothetical protein [Caudoviricetes sp.]